MMRRPTTVVIGTLIAIVASAALAVRISRAQQTTGNFNKLLDQVGISPEIGQKVPLDLEFVDSSGKKIRLSDCFIGRPVILHLVYYQCPMLCQLSRDGLLGTLSTIKLKPGRDFSIVTLSFDPREGPDLSARARALAAQRCGAEAVENGWHFLTGGSAAISALTEAVGFRYTFDEKTAQFAHSTGLFILAPDGTISRFLGGIDYSPRDLRLALVEASQGKVGTLTDHAMLLCYMYDPTVGKYGFAIVTVLRIAGLTTVGILTIGILLMIRHDRHKQLNAIKQKNANSPADLAPA
jgi:protein SCO1/2